MVNQKVGYDSIRCVQYEVRLREIVVDQVAETGVCDRATYKWMYVSSVHRSSYATLRSSDHESPSMYLYTMTRDYLYERLRVKPDMDGDFSLLKYRATVTVA